MNPTHQDARVLEVPSAVTTTVIDDDLRVLEVHLRVPRTYTVSKLEQLILTTTRIVQVEMVYEVIPDSTILHLRRHRCSLSRTCVIRFRIQRMHIKNGRRSDELVGRISQAFDSVRINYQFSRTVTPETP